MIDSHPPSSRRPSRHHATRRYPLPHGGDRPLPASPLHRPLAHQLFPRRPLHQLSAEAASISQIMEDGCTDNPISLPNVNTEVFSLVINYCRKHAENPSATEETYCKVFYQIVENYKNRLRTAANPDGEGVTVEEMEAWDSEFVKLNKGTVYNLIMG